MQGKWTRHGIGVALGLAALIAPSGAWAHGRDGHHEPREWQGGSWYGDAPAADYSHEGRYDEAAPGYDPRARDAWLADCRQRVSSRDRGVGGAVIGGVVGGVAGNRIAGRGSRTVGTVAGAAVGAVAGAAIDKAEDRGRVRDECEAYLDDYYAGYDARPAHGSYPAYGYGSYPAYTPAYGYASPTPCCGAAPVMMVPVVQSAPQCTETVEYVYEDVPVRRKAYHTPAKQTKVVRDKRVID